MLYILTLLFLLIGLPLNAQISGCTDTKAGNFNSQATENNGSCKYVETFKTPNKLTDLNNDISETSGIVLFDGNIWTHNDSGGEPALYSIDRITGNVIKKVVIAGVAAIDWEDVARDDEFVYIGDFGNNNGNRKDLRIVKFPLLELNQDTAFASIMTFNYADQTDFTSLPQNNDFDAEALISFGDSLYIFSKNWKSLKSRIYVLPKSFNDYTANVIGELTPSGLITGADFLKSEKVFVLCGYNKILQPFIYMMWDYGNKVFTEGNRRKINLNLPLHQVEGVAINQLNQAYLTNESLAKGSINIQASLYEVNLTEWITPAVVTSSNDIKITESIKLYPNPTKDFLNIEWPSDLKIQQIEIFSIDGKYSEVWPQNILENKVNLDLLDFNNGMYILKLSSQSGTCFQRFIKN